MEIEFRHSSFITRFLIKSRLYLLFIFIILIQIVVFIVMIMGEHDKELTINWSAIGRFNLLAFCSFVPFIIQDFLFSRKYLYKINLTDKTITLYYKHYNSNSEINIDLDDLQTIVETNKFALSKAPLYIMDFKIKHKLKSKRLFRQHEIDYWTESKLTKLDNIIELRKKTLLSSLSTSKKL